MSEATGEHVRKSYESINYSLRPAKAAERKMLTEGFRKLNAFLRIEEYRYIGFGSTYFSDFSLIHRSLGISRMISIEKNSNDQPRFEFNKPYKCIELKFGLSSEILPTLNWDTPTILWLDYDGHLDENVLGDIGLFCAKAQPSSMIVVSVNAHPDSLDYSRLQQPYNPDTVLNEFRLNRLIEAVGRDRIPPGIKGKDLSLKGKACVLRKVIYNTIMTTLSERNGGTSNDEKIEYRQVFNFIYQDGAKMLTTGGVLYTANQGTTITQCGFENMVFYRPNEISFDIGVPKLTFREMRFLDKKLPPRNQDGDNVSLPIEDLGDLVAVPQEDIQNYLKIYRYFPNFAETDI